MAVKLKWAWLGVAIPCFLISFVAYGTHIFIFASRLSKEEQLWFEFCVSMIWLSYYLAIVVPAGSPPPNYKLPESKPRRAWKKWCSKCKLYKPERAHHCKTCRRCVLKMDHHCPWTMNCIGYNNMPHFTRFLLWVFYTTGYVFWQLSKVMYEYYLNRNLPSYLFSITEVSLCIIIYLTNGLVLFSISMLLIRTLNSIMFSGMTTIEGWDMERLESQFYSKKLWRRIRKNYEKIHQRAMPSLTSWKTSPLADIELEDLNEENADTREELESIGFIKPKETKNELPFEFTIEDLVFPYTFSAYHNLVLTMGPIYLWLWPWGSPMGHGHGDGLTYERNTEDQEDQLDLPWPPDGHDQDDVVHDRHDDDVDVEVNNENEEMVTRRNAVGYYRSILDPRLNMDRNEWSNDFGETLEDFGVDVETDGSDQEEGDTCSSGFAEVDGTDSVRHRLTA